MANLNPVQSFGSNLIVTILAKNAFCPYCDCVLTANNYSIEHVEPKSSNNYNGNPFADYANCNLQSARQNDVQKDFFNLIACCRACNMRISNFEKTSITGEVISKDELFQIACKQPTENEVVETLKHYFKSNPNHKLFRKMLGLDYAPNKKLSYKLIEKVFA